MVIKITETNPQTDNQSKDLVNFSFKLSNRTDYFEVSKEELFFVKNKVSLDLPVNKNIPIISNELETQDSLPVFSVENDNMTILQNIENRLVRHGIIKELNNDKVVDLIIESENDLIGCQPWSYFLNTYGIKSKQIRCVLKKHSDSTPDTDSTVENSDFNLLALVSKANIDQDGYSIGKIFYNFSDEIGSIVKLMLEDTQSPSLKPTKFTIVKFIDKTSIVRAPLNEYNFLHLLMHGQNGQLGFESEDDINILDWVKKEDVIFFLKKEPFKKFKLIFLSLCDGAKGSVDDYSLAFDLIKNNIAENVIGFNGGIGSDLSAKIFSNYFYKAYLEYPDIVKAYGVAVEDFIAEQNNYWFRPVLYTEKYE